ncbi:MAG: HEAT repeat domain-containing protein [Clostridiales bacterium]
MLSLEQISRGYLPQLKNIISFSYYYHQSKSSCKAGDIANPALEASQYALIAALKEIRTLPGHLQKLCHTWDDCFLPLVIDSFASFAPLVQEELQFIAGEERWLARLLLHAGEDAYAPKFFIEGWRYLADEALLADLVELLASKHEYIRMYGVDILSKLQDKRVLPYLVAALLQPHSYLPARVGQVFLAYGQDSASLIAELLPYLDGSRKKPFLQILAEFSVDYPFANVLNCLAEDDDEIRVEAILALANFPYQQIFPVLESYGDDSCWKVRAAIAWVLGNWHFSEGKKYLQRYLHDESFGVRANARAALLQLG